MKKVITLSTLWVALIQLTFAQSSLKDTSFSYYGSAKENRPPGLVTAFSSKNDYSSSFPARNRVMDSLVKDSSFLRHRTRQFYWVESYDPVPATFFVDGVVREQLGRYEFRVMLNGRQEAASWQRVSEQAGSFATPYHRGKKMFFLGRYDAPFGSYLLVDLRQAGSDSILSTTVVLWPSIQPVVTNIYTPDQLNLFFNRLSQSHRIYDTAAALVPEHLVFKPTDNNLLFFLKGIITSKGQVEYQLIRNGTTYAGWQQNDFDQPFIWLRNLPPGEYRLEIRYRVQPQHISIYPFRIEAAWNQTTTFKIILGSLTAPFLGCILLLVRVRKQKRSLVREQQKKEKMEVELRAIRSQLNPHFIFNSMTSIQGLINRSDMERANQYLSSFAILMRNVLNGTARESNPLHQEIRILENYLSLEQLRFNFSYTIGTAADINPFEVEIPALLIQPLVENSVKHGVSGLGGRGRINVSFTRHKDDMIADIEDNGHGFEPEKNTDGFGLALTRRRIAVINELSPDRSVDMEIKFVEGTRIRITFKNWLA